MKSGKDDKMGRRELRENIFKLIFRIEYHKNEEMKEQVELFLESLGEIEQQDYEYIENKYNEIIEKLAEIDETINSATEGWKTGRMGKVELAIVRLAVFEMKFEEDIPVGVAINEAVELSKKYGGDDSPSFINGILAKMV